ncbi:MAG: hypothetical protein ABC585_02685 [Candidatus Methanosuratincola petrocarbonis]
MRPWKASMKRSGTPRRAISLANQKRRTWGVMWRPVLWWAKRKRVDLCDPRMGNSLSESFLSLIQTVSSSSNSSL